MQTHTLQKAGRNSSCIKFTPAFIERLKAAHPWAARIAVAKLSAFLTLPVEPEQASQLEALLAPVPARNYQLHMALDWLAQGCRLQDAELPEILDILDAAARSLHSDPSGLSPKIDSSLRG